MSVVLLDTTFLVDAERGGLDLDVVIDDEDDVAVAAITVAEMLVGVELASSRRPQRESFVADVVSSIPIVPYDLSVAGEHAKLLVAVRTAGRPRGAHDLIIAATARATNRTVITADPEAFEELPGVDVHLHR